MYIGHGSILLKCKTFRHTDEHKNIGGASFFVQKHQKLFREMAIKQSLKFQQGYELGEAM